MTAMTAFLLAGLATWLLRIGFVVLVPASRLPASVRSSLDFLPPAVLASIVALDLAGAVGTGDRADVLTTLAAAGVIGLAAWRTRNLALCTLLALALVALLDLAL